MELLKEIILYIVTSLEGSVSRTRIVKLLYLVHFFSLAKLGSKVTGVNYNYYYYGPYSESIVQCVNELKSSGLLQEYVLQNSFGNNSFLYNATKPFKNIPSLSSSPDKVVIVNDVIKEYGKMNFKQLLEFVYSTPPIEDNRQGKVNVI